MSKKHHESDGIVAATGDVSAVVIPDALKRLDWAKLEDAVGSIVEQLAKSTDTPLDDIAVHLGREALKQLIVEYLTPRMFSGPANAHAQEKLVGTFMNAGVKGAVPAWLIALLVPLGQQFLQDLLKKLLPKDGQPVAPQA